MRTANDTHMGQEVLCGALELAPKSRVLHLDCRMDIFPFLFFAHVWFFQVHNLFSSLDLGEWGRGAEDVFN